MKHLILFAALFVCISASAQKTPVKKPATVTKTPTAANPLKNLTDSVSYAIGSMVANFYKQQGIKQLNSVALTKAVNDIYANRKSLLTEAEANLTLMRYLNPALSKTIAEGEKFLKDNKTKSGILITSSGLQYQVLTRGTGAQPTSAADTVTVNYAGTLLNGVEFDNSYKRGSPISFPLTNVIAGWTEGLQLMNVGSKYKFYIPNNLGYGMNDNGQIPGGSVLVFEIELLDVKKAQ